MNKIINNFNSLFIKKEKQILFLILGFLGFSVGCEVIDPKAEYGTPSADFILNGQVKSASSGEAIPDIRVIVEEDTIYGNNGYMQQYADTLYTDLNGTFRFEAHSFPQKQYFKLNLTDVDGNENGSFIQKDAQVAFEDGPYVGGSGWYSGSVDKNVDFSLEESNEE